MLRVLSFCLFLSSVALAGEPGDSPLAICANLLVDEPVLPGVPRVIDGKIVRMGDNEVLLLGHRQEQWTRAWRFYYVTVNMRDLIANPNRVIVVKESDVSYRHFPGSIFNGTIGQMEDLATATITIDVAHERDGDFYTISFSNIRLTK
jgi:hypothetical protein